MPAEPQATLPLPHAHKGGSRARSLPYRGPYLVAVALSAVHYLACLALLTSVTMFLMQPSQLTSRVIVGSVAFTVITWLASFLKRRSTFCPLCKGTPLANSGALTHSKAVRIPPLNHGGTATLSILATQQFRCMYCGSHFDLLKDPAHLRNSRGTTGGESSTYYEETDPGQG